MKMRDFNVNQESHVDGGEILMRKLSGSLRGVKFALTLAPSTLKWKTNLEIDIKIEKLYEITVIPCHHHHSADYQCLMRAIWDVGTF